MQVVWELRRLGHDVLTTLDAGNANFLQLHRHRTADHAGIVLCTFDTNFPAQAQRIDAAVATEIEMTNKLIRVNRPG